MRLRSHYIETTYFYWVSWTVELQKQKKGATDVNNDHGQKKETEIKATAVEKEIVIEKGSEKSGSK